MLFWLFTVIFIQFIQKRFHLAHQMIFLLVLGHVSEHHRCLKFSCIAVSYNATHWSEAKGPLTTRRPEITIIIPHICLASFENKMITLETRSLECVLQLYTTMAQYSQEERWYRLKQDKKFVWVYSVVSVVSSAVSCSNDSCQPARLAEGKWSLISRQKPGRCVARKLLLTDFVTGVRQIRWWTSSVPRSADFHCLVRNGKQEDKQHGRLMPPWQQRRACRDPVWLFLGDTSSILESQQSKHWPVPSVHGVWPGAPISPLFTQV